MTAKRRNLSDDPMEFIMALRLAVEASANTETERALIMQILDMAPDGDQDSTASVQILLIAMREIGGALTT